MSSKNLQVVGYAAGASLAAITLFYVFGPTFFIDGDESSGFFDSKKRTIVGLSNPANDCFINSTLQALAGLGDLRLYLIKEIHRRELDGPEVYDGLPAVLRKGDRPQRVQDLQRGLVTKALKDMLDALNERPIYRKTITARPLIESLERAYNTRISRNQQDAQEFLQIVLERLDDEYNAGEKARSRARGPAGETESVTEESPATQSLSSAAIGASEGFPFEGRLESQIQCMYCGFKTKPSGSTFVSLTLNVPQGNSTTLDKCFDILLKDDDIDDYRCDRCRLKHALDWKKAKLVRAAQDDQRKQLQSDIVKLEKAIEADPETQPEGVELPDSAQAPRRKIKKYTRITRFPKVIAIHLSRSVFDERSYSTKNMAKVNYTERLRLGGILNVHWYRLLGVVCHKGSHNSGHYESFRRNHIYPPFATVDTWGAYAASSKAPSAASSPKVTIDANGHSSTTSESAPSVSSAALSPENSRPNTTDDPSHAISSNADRPPNTVHLKRTVTQTSQPQIRSHVGVPTKHKKRKKQDRWWRVSDDKIKEAKTSEVLNMQREVYLLFYELERPQADAED
ncbi:hypothetical protein LTR05_005810 [Lithohypha guttulata]|uniref:Ubiquitin carboxyl-terminal hydrolase n=1 Tax=Lithohypha guttulata TaxID=1690604 RepID=A0AAN7Y5Q2_9EURO|nr:hypothetical protein LTR05_005810 [Lithohypha guttulata]